jgi:transcriptional regulator with XRE-family HTH domain
MKINLTAIREKKGFTVTSLANMVNVNKSSISKIENGKALPSVELLVKISKALNTPIDDLICGKDVLLGHNVACDNNKEEAK